MADPTGANLTSGDVKLLDRLSLVWGRLRIGERLQALRDDLDAVIVSSAVSFAEVLAALGAASEAVDFNSQSVSGIDDVGCATVTATGDVDSGGTLKGDAIAPHGAGTVVDVNGTSVDSATDTWTPTSGTMNVAGALAATGAVTGTNLPLYRAVTAADFPKAGNVAEEVIHALSIPAAAIGTTRRQIKVRGFLGSVTFDGAETIRLRVRVGGLTGVVVVDTTALVTAEWGTLLQFEADCQIRSVGAAGDFNSVGHFFCNGSEAVGTAMQAGGTVNTTAALDVAVTVEAPAGNSVTLTEFSVEVWPA